MPDGREIRVRPDNSAREFPEYGLINSPPPANDLIIAAAGTDHRIRFRIATANRRRPCPQFRRRISAVLTPLRSQARIVSMTSTSFPNWYGLARA